MIRRCGFRKKPRKGGIILGPMDVRRDRSIQFATAQPPIGFFIVSIVRSTLSLTVSAAPFRSGERPC
jgi:hypothetical protein